jgi:hypothetical protein
MEKLFAFIPSVSRIVAHLFRLILLLGDELPSSLHPVLYLLGLLLQRFEPGKHLSVSSEVRMFNVPGTTLQHGPHAPSPSSLL